MATQDNTNPESGFGSPYVDTLVRGQSSWSITNGPVTYYLANASDAVNNPHPNTAGYSDWSAAEIAAFRQVLQNYADVCGLTFAPASDIGSSNLIEWQVGNGFGGAGVQGLHQMPDANDPIESRYGAYNAQNAFLDQIQQGGLGYELFLHELGHAMGLNHPFDSTPLFPGVQVSGDLGTYELNQTVYTVMSYNEGYNGQPPTSNAYGLAGTLGTLDIAALQAVYGANMTTRTGDDTYTLPTANATGTFWSSIWDAGGTDTIDNSASTLAATIDLRVAELNGAHAGGYISSNAGIQGGLLIANGAVIENVIGGSGSDTITGNDADNTIDGGQGADRIEGGVGKDTLRGGDGNDVLKDRGAPTTDIPSTVVVKAAGAGNSAIATALDVTAHLAIGQDPDIGTLATIPNVSIAATGDGTVDYYAVTVGAGATLTFDIDHTPSNGTLDPWIHLYGPAGDEIAQNDDAGVVDPGSDSDFDSYLSYTVDTAGTYTISVGVYGGPGIVAPVGSGLTYVLQVSATGISVPDIDFRDADTLDGGAGADTLAAGFGDDTYYVDNSGDRVIEATGQGTDTVLTSVAYTLKSGQEIEVLATTDDAGTAAINLTGNAFANTLRGNAGANTLTGGGSDTLLGLGGDDRLILTASPARVDGGLGIDKLIVRGGSVILTDADFAGVERVYAGNDVSLVMTGVTVGAIITSQSTAGHHATITGTAGADRIVAGKGGDTLDGAAGSDALIAGAGDDTLHFSTSFGRDVIYRFETAHDTLDLSALASGMAELEITAVHGGSNTQITVVGDTDPAQKIILVDVDAAQLIANGQFLFGA